MNDELSKLESEFKTYEKMAISLAKNLDELENDISSIKKVIEGYDGRMLTMALRIVELQERFENREEPSKEKIWKWEFVHHEEGSVLPCEAGDFCTNPERNSKPGNSYGYWSRGPIRLRTCSQNCAEVWIQKLKEGNQLLSKSLTMKFGR